MNFVDVDSSPAFKVTEKHSALVTNIGTFAEEDDAHKLLNSLSISLPVIVIATWVLDALLAAVYLKWLHPWRILLQEVSYLIKEVWLLNSLSINRNQTNGSLRRMIKQKLTR